MHKDLVMNNTVDGMDNFFNCGFEIQKPHMQILSSNM